MIIEDIEKLLAPIGRAAVAAAEVLARATTVQKNAALEAAAQALRRRRDEILAANAQDLEVARSRGLAAAMIDRLALDAARVEAMARGVEEIARLADPVGTVLAEWERPNGLRIQRVRVPLGVIGIIYESRPNVTCDAGALCLKSGNAAILRGGSESHRSSTAIHACLADGLRAAGLPEALHPARADDRPRRRRLHAGRHDRLDRRDRAAGRQEPRRARAAGSARAGHRPPRRQLPRLRRSRGGPQHGARDRR